MADIWDFSPLMIAAKKADKAGMEHTENIEYLNNAWVQGEQQINSSRAAAICSFNAANLLYRLAAEEFRKINNHVYSNNAYTKGNDMEIKAEELNSQQRQMEVLYNPPIELSLERIIHPPTTTNLEHQVASWASTMAIQVFEKVKNDKGLSQWIFTPEQRDEESGKIPDLVLEQVFQEPDGELYAKPWLCMEFKKLGGAPPYKALHQVATAVKGKLNEITNTDVLTYILLLLLELKSPFGRWTSKRSMVVNLNKMSILCGVADLFCRAALNMTGWTTKARNLHTRQIKITSLEKFKGFSYAEL